MQILPDHRFKLLAFDMAGMLVEHQAAKVGALVEAFKGTAFKVPTTAQVSEVAGLDLKLRVKQLAPQASQAEVLELTKRYRSAIQSQLARGEQSVRLFDGVDTTLGALAHDETYMAVVTGKDRRGLDATLEMHGFGQHFHSLQTPDTNPRKPAPDMVWNANNETATEAQDTVVIGDTSYDMEMARNAGAFAIGVTYGNHTEARLRQSGAHVLIHSFAELPAALKELSHEDYRA